MSDWIYMFLSLCHTCLLGSACYCPSWACFLASFFCATTPYLCLSIGSFSQASLYHFVLQQHYSVNSEIAQEINVYYWIIYKTIILPLLKREKTQNKLDFYRLESPSSFYDLNALSFWMSFCAFSWSHLFYYFVIVIITYKP